MEQHLRGTPDGHLDRAADHRDRDPGDRGGAPPALNPCDPEPEALPFDEGGILKGGGFIIPASTMRPAPQLSPEQVAAYNRLFGLTRDPEES